MFKNIGIVIKRGLHLDSEIIEKIKSLTNKTEIQNLPFETLQKKDFEKKDLIITFGGDGTFVKAANLIENIPILGINAEPKTSEGALTSITVREIHKLENIFLGKYKIILRHRAKVILNSKILEEHAINEVYVGAHSQFHSSRYIISFNNKTEEQRSSGVIISTGTGSAAWFYSAGGEIFSHEEEKLSFIIREPYFGKRVFKPTIIKGNIHNGEKLIIESKRHSGGIITINDSTYDFNDGDLVEIELSDKPLNVIQVAF